MRRIDTVARGLGVMALAAILTGCASGALPAATTRGDWLASQPTPAAWAPGRRWTFVQLDADGRITRSMTTRLSGEPVDACTSGMWLRLDIVAQDPAPPARDPASPLAQFVPVAAYSVHGRSLVIDFNSTMCDAAYEYRGELDARGFRGRAGSSTPWGGSADGAVYGAPVAD